MNDPNCEHHEPMPIGNPDDASLVERERLISRIIDAEDADAAWERLTQIGTTDPSVWRDLAQSQRQHAMLAAAVTAAVRIADGIDLPTGNASRARRNESYTLSRWSGWAIAAMLGLAWIASMYGNLTGTVSPTNGSPANTNIAGPGLAAWQPRDHQEALNKYLEVGQREGAVIGEVPRVLMIESRPAANGTVEVFYLRQFMERAVVNDSQISQDENGVKFRFARPAPTKPGGKL
jgi:hypothetical protein